ncbi:hypothetical protein B9Z55_000595 [Caenorhabditis nigoni]|uniref:Uncharacterized protein n=1 Tax=Caenorhabditis nigoni TaxID=1611254 RepID=A0A2G5VTT9_9PELO|nr:hypothetical protein B9Z55_000595 [Caenorhabditis nigoni]
MAAESGKAVQLTRCPFIRKDGFLTLLGCVWGSLERKLCGNPTPRNHNTSVNEMEQGQVAHVAVAENPASAPRRKKIHIFLFFSV